MASESFPQHLPKGFDERRVRSHIAESHKYFEDLEKAWDQLLAEHEGEWVASYKDKFVFGRSIKEVLAAARHKTWPLDVIAIDHLAKERPTVLL